MSAENVRIVLAHMADNAQRHGATELAISAERTDETLHITLRDNGTGISHANRALIFDSFFTTRRDSGGTGMGLAIVRAIVAAHGGSIALIDEEIGGAQGAAFVLHVPVASS